MSFVIRGRKVLKVFNIPASSQEVQISSQDLLEEKISLQRRIDEINIDLAGVLVKESEILEDIPIEEARE